MPVRSALVAALVAVAACAKHVPPPRAPTPPVEAPPEPAPPPPPPSPEPAEEMSVKGTIGVLGDEDIAETFRARWTEVTRCLRESAPRLPYLVGKVELKFRVDASGAPAAVHVQRSDLGHYAAERCLLEVAGSLRFPPPRGGGDAEFSYPIEYRPARASMAALELDGDPIGPTLERNVKALDWCRVPPDKAPPPPPKHSARRRRHDRAWVPPPPRGPLRPIPRHLRMTLYVKGGGKVVTAGLSADGPLDPALASCLVTSAGLWRLDDPPSRVAKVSFEVGR